MTERESLGEFPLSLRVTACANGETFEYRLYIGTEQAGNSLFLSGKPTAERKRHALTMILGQLG